MSQGAQSQILLIHSSRKIIGIPTFVTRLKSCSTPINELQAFSSIICLFVKSLKRALSCCQCVSFKVFVFLGCLQCEQICQTCKAKG